MDENTLSQDSGQQQALPEGEAQLESTAPVSPVQTATQTAQPPTGMALLQKLLAEMSGVSADISLIKTVMEKRLSYDQTKETAFDQLYKELDELKKNTEFERNRSIYMDLILLYDRIENIRLNLSGASDQSSDSSGALLSSLSDEVIEILYRRGIEAIVTDPTVFDKAIQQAIGTEPAASESENNQVARVVRKGFRYQDRILRAEEVIIKKYIS